MRFKDSEDQNPQLAVEYSRIHPEVKKVCVLLEEFCVAHNLPEPMATHIKRTRDGQESIYWKQMMKPGISEAQARHDARNRWTWHFVFCAIDLRDWIYSDDQIVAVVAFLRKACTGPNWEFLYHDVGRGKHLHIGYRDHQWKNSIPVAER